MKRPATLAEAARIGAATANADAAFREFLDEYYLTDDSAAKARMLAEAPPLVAPHRDAYYAAAAEHLALRDGLPIPDWVREPSRFLHEPYFPSGLESLKAMLIVESPASFRRRMIFVDKDPLYRPRRDGKGFTPLPPRERSR
jgi:hypothetical protein